MKTFKIDIQETLSRIIDIEASSSEEAISIAQKMYETTEIVLDYDDFVDCNISDLENQPFEQVKEAKLLLESNGFQAEELWSIYDVKQTFNCTHDQAMQVLKAALTNENVMFYIFDEISRQATEMGLTLKD